MIRLHRPAFTVAAITAYAALMQALERSPADLSCLRAAYTGGAPVAPATAAAWFEVLYTHAAVREAAVVGIADDYRGETIKAFVSLAAGRPSSQTN